MSKPKLLVLFGESGSGKDTIEKWLVHTCHFHKAISYTTRPPREGEIDGIDYHFVSAEEFMKLVKTKEIIEYFTFNDWYYGTAKSEILPNRINVITVDSFRAETLVLQCPEVDAIAVWIKTADKTRLLRNLKRESSPNCKEICRRFLADLQDYKAVLCNYEIFDNNEDGVEDFYGLLNRPKVKAFLQEDKNN